jgi:hypothetical protein
LAILDLPVIPIRIQMEIVREADRRMYHEKASMKSASMPVRNQ